MNEKSCVNPDLCKLIEQIDKFRKENAFGTIEIRIVHHKITHANLRTDERIGVEEKHVKSVA